MAPGFRIIDFVSQINICNDNSYNTNGTCRTDVFEWGGRWSAQSRLKFPDKLPPIQGIQEIDEAWGPIHNWKRK